MDFREIPVEIKKAWLLDTYRYGLISREEYESDLKELEEEEERNSGERGRGDEPAGMKDEEKRR